MFQTEPILWLQSIGSPPLSALFSLVTLLGYAPVYVTLLLVLAFALRLRPTLGVAGALLLAGLLTEGLKDAVAYPRPDEVDARIARSSEAMTVALLARGGAAGFWSRPQPQAIAAVRRRASGNHGFPSGHVAAATAFLICSAYFFRTRRALAFAALWLPLMALSRMYLGRHFLADVLGGLAIGLIASALAVLLFRGLDEEVFRRHDRRASLALAPVALLSLVLLALSPGEPLLRPEYVGGLAGLAVSCACLLARGLPPDGGSARQRALRVVVAGSVFLSGLWATEALLSLVGRQGARVVTLAGTLLVATASLAGTAALCRRLGLYPAPR